jgi:aminoglycoside 3-N-acetyltransferase
VRTSPAERARKLAASTPRPVREALRTGLRRYRSARYRLRERLSPVTLSAEDVAGALRECGLGAGDACFMQSAMSAFGAFEDGPDTVIAGVEDVVGPDGLITMPTYSSRGPTIEYLAGDPIFDVGKTPSRLGAISEAFRVRDGTLRSLHPTHSVCARGLGAEEVLAGHHLADAPFGPGTPFVRIPERDALQIFFGCGPGPLTMYHPFECTRVPPFPLDVFAKRVFSVRCRDAGGVETRVRTLVHEPTLLPGRIDNNRHLQAVFRDAMLDAGGVAVELGRGEILAIRLPVLFDVFERLLERGITIYDHPLPAEEPTEPPQERVDG